MSVTHGLGAAERLEENYRVTFDEIAEMRRVLQQQQQQQPSSQPASAQPQQQPHQQQQQQHAHRGAAAHGDGAARPSLSELQRQYERSTAPLASYGAAAHDEYGAGDDGDDAAGDAAAAAEQHRRVDDHAAASPFARGTAQFRPVTAPAAASGAGTGAATTGDAPQLGAEERRRIEEFKAMLAERRSTALEAFGASNGQVERMKALLSERPPTNLSLASARDTSALSASGVGASGAGDYDTSMVSAPRSARDGSSPHRKPVYERLFDMGLNSKLKLDLARRQQETSSSQAGSAQAPRINPQSAGMKRDAPVEAILMRRNAEYKAHIEDLRREKEQRELRELRQPKLTKAARTAPRTEAVESRLQEFGRQAVLKREKLRSAMLEERTRDVKVTPRINTTSKTIHRSVDQMLAWQQERDRKIQMQKEQLVNRELSEVVGRPQISKTSERLARRMGRLHRIEDQLALEQERSEQRRSHSAPREAVRGHPQISAHSANLQRDGDVADRLYNLAKLQKQQQEISQLQQQLPPDRDPSTGQRLFQPVINQRSASIVRSAPIEDVLYGAGSISMSSSGTAGDLSARRRSALRSREALEAEAETQRVAEANRSKMGDRSRILAENLERRTNQSTMERLTQPIRQLRPQSARAFASEEEETCTFRPSINPISEQIDRTVNGSSTPMARTEALLRKHREYLENRERLISDQVSAELEACTFSPQPQRARSRSAGRLAGAGAAGAGASAAAGAASAGAGAGAGAGDAVDASVNSSMASGSGAANLSRSSRTASFADRNIEWMRRREQRLQAERGKKEEQELTGCTFKPDTRSSAASRRERLLSDTYSSASKRAASSQSVGDHTRSGSQHDGRSYDSSGAAGASFDAGSAHDHSGFGYAAAHDGANAFGALGAEANRVVDDDDDDNDDAGADYADADAYAGTGAYDSRADLGDAGADADAAAAANAFDAYGPAAAAYDGSASGRGEAGAGDDEQEEALWRDAANWLKRVGLASSTE